MESLLAYILYGLFGTMKASISKNGKLVITYSKRNGYYSKNLVYIRYFISSFQTACNHLEWRGSYT